MRLTGDGRRSAGEVRGAFTVIEVLVTVAIIGLLAALLVPAVQGARGVARRAQCVANLKQMGIAFSSYESVYTVFPQGANGMTSFSAHAMILPFLEQRPLFDAINFSAEPYLNSPSLVTTNNTTVAVFLCPADLRPPRDYGQTNYAGNGGVGSYWNRANGIMSPVNAISRTYFGYAGVRDGASQTAMMSEWVMGNYQELNPRGVAFKTPSFIAPDEFEPCVAACRELSLTPANLSAWHKSGHWIIGGFFNSILNHNLPINGHSCTNNGDIGSGTWTAGSRHAGGGANTLFVDGHAKFLRDTISPAAWRALGTRNGLETISESY